MHITLKKLIEQVNEKNKNINIIFIKGNPKYEIVPETKIFYNKIKEIIKKYGNYIELESDTNSKPIADKIKSKNDIIIGFSRGCGYKPYLKKYFNKSNYYIGIGCSKKEEGEIDLDIKNPLDNTPDDMSEESIQQHWILTDEMIVKLNAKLKEITKIK